MTSGPLADVRVVALEGFGAGPWATLQLADLGADVLKVEDPRAGGDPGRAVPPGRAGGTSLYFEAFNRGKRSMALDLRAPAGREVLEDLVAGSDVLFANLRGTSFDRLRLGYDALAHVNPRIVCCSLSGFGRTGPRAGEGVYDHVVQALAGWMALTGGPAEEPTRSGVSLADYVAGQVAATAMLAGLLQAHRTGRGCDCDVSLFEVALAQLNYLATWSLSTGWKPVRRARSAHQALVPFQMLAARDGWLVVAAPKQALWLRFLDALALGELADDARFADLESRAEHRDALVGLVEARLAEEDVATWLERLRDHGVPCAPVNDLAGALADPQTVARGAVGSVAHPELGTVHHVLGPVRIGAPPRAPAPPRLAPGLDQHGVAVLRERCGYDDTRIAGLRDAGALGLGPQPAS